MFFRVKKIQNGRTLYIDLPRQAGFRQAERERLKHTPLPPDQDPKTIKSHKRWVAQLDLWSKEAREKKKRRLTAVDNYGEELVKEQEMLFQKVKISCFSY